MGQGKLTDALVEGTHIAVTQDGQERAGVAAVRRVPDTGLLMDWSR